MTTKKNNYEIQANRARTIFLKEDQVKLIQKFNLKADQSYLYVQFMDMTYLIDRNSGCIKKTVNNVTFTEDNSYCTTLSIFDYLCLSQEERQLSGKWVNMQEMGHMIHANILEGKGDMFAKEAKLFAAHKKELQVICEHLNGQKMSTGDMSYILKLFDEMSIYFQFWDGDDEFPPQFRFLWDTNIQQYVHYDTLFSIVSMFLNRMKELMNIK